MHLARAVGLTDGKGYGSVVRGGGEWNFLARLHYGEGDRNVDVFAGRSDTVGHFGVGIVRRMHNIELIGYVPVQVHVIRSGGGVGTSVGLEFIFNGQKRVGERMIFNHGFNENQGIQFRH